MQSRLNWTLLLTLLAFNCFQNHFAVAQTEPAKTKVTFEITLSKTIDSKPVSGRLFLFFSKSHRSPIEGPNWFGPEPFFGVDVTDFGPGDTIEIDETTKGYPGSMDDIESRNWRIQALLDHDLDYSNHVIGPGNFFSAPQQITFRKGQDNGKISLVLHQTIGEPTIKETDHFKLIEFKSELLSKFHNREVINRAGILLPASYFSNKTKRYPVYYKISGFGGTLSSISRIQARQKPKIRDGEAEFIRVYLTGQCKNGHHVYADSANNGPRGAALIEEMIPFIDNHFRTIAEPTARFVGGHSSGGWSSLWLQVTYPDTFGGVWSTAPDPVDFRDWQGTDLYRNESVFFRSDGSKKPLARENGREIVMYKDFCRMDDTLARGGQLASFEAVFSPRDQDGKPKKCWDRETGVPDPEVVEYWKQYDISHVLKENWDTLGPKLKGKIHLYMGSADTYYLEGASILFGERMKELGSDAVVEIFPGKSHRSLMNPDLRRRIRREMTAAFRAHHPQDNATNSNRN